MITTLTGLSHVRQRRRTGSLMYATLRVWCSLSGPRNEARASTVVAFIEFRSRVRGQAAALPSFGRSSSTRYREGIGRASFTPSGVARISKWAAGK